MRFLRSIAFILILAAGIRTNALGKTANIGFATGGDRLTDATGGSYDLRAGGGLHLSGGLIFTVTPTKPHRFELQTGLGYTVLNDNSKKGSEVTFHRFPVEALYFYRNTRKNFRLGYGIQYHVYGSVAGKGLNSAVDTPIDSALGWVLAMESLFPMATDGHFAGLGIRYVMIDYRASAFARVLNGNSVLITLSWNQL